MQKVVLGFMEINPFSRYRPVPATALIRNRESSHIVGDANPNVGRTSHLQLDVQQLPPGRGSAAGKGKGGRAVGVPAVVSRPVVRRAREALRHGSPPHQIPTRASAKQSARE